MELTGFRIVFIGAGNVATHLATAFAKAGFKIAQVFSRTDISASQLGRKLHCPYTTRLEKLTLDADLYIVSIKDSAMTEVLPKLTACNPNALFVHTAGSMPMNIWKGITKRYGVLYPMQTFSKQCTPDINTTPFFIEACTPEDCGLLKILTGAISTKVYEATSEQRRYLHIAAVFACNFTNHMYAVSEYLLTTHGLPFDVMLPLIDETARKIHDLSPVKAQTGPAQRNDTNVIRRHLEMLQNEPELARLYELLSKNIHEFHKTTNCKT